MVENGHLQPSRYGVQYIEWLNVFSRLFTDSLGDCIVVKFAGSSLYIQIPVSMEPVPNISYAFSLFKLAQIYHFKINNGIDKSQYQNKQILPLREEVMYGTIMEKAVMKFFLSIFI